MEIIHFSSIMEELPFENHFETKLFLRTRTIRKTTFKKSWETFKLFHANLYHDPLMAGVLEQM
jgi:hypothetical protein